MTQKITKPSKTHKIMISLKDKNKEILIENITKYNNNDDTGICKECGMEQVYIISNMCHKCYLDCV